MFFDKPDQYAMTDVAEDLPGTLQPLGGIVKNVLPSLSIISEDKDERKKQIDAAVAKIKAMKAERKPPVGHILQNALDMGKASILPSLAFSLLLGKSGPLRLPWGTIVNGAAKTVSKGLRSPIDLRAFKRIFSTGRTGAVARNHVFHDVGTNVGLAALTGAAYPILEHARPVSDAALESARKVMEEDPYLTSLPANEILSAANARSGRPMDRVQSGLLGAGLGAGLGAASAFTPGLLQAAASLLSGGKLGPRGGLLGRQFVKTLKSNARNSALFGGLTGGLGGYMTNSASGALSATVPDNRSPVPPPQNVPSQLQEPASNPAQPGRVPVQLS